ncbi:DUF3105 domain-containing protein [Jatrophihabitans fulvus]
MAERKSSPSGKSGGSTRPANRSRQGGGGAKSGPSKPGSSRGVDTSKRPAGSGSKPAAKSAAKPAAAGGRPPNRKKPKSIVNQKQTPWGLIATTIAVVLFAAAVVVVVIATRPGSDDFDGTSAGGQPVDTSDPYRQPELAAAAAIKGVTYRVQGNHNHEQGTIKYDTTPPTGGDHNAYWADCAGTVYGKAIANENAVHMLEHGAIWITYNANQVKGAQLAKLKSYVAGKDRMAMSPYPGLKTPISLQAWGYQLKVSSASDPRIAQFIKVLDNNQKTTPEYGATCSQPTFKDKPSSFGDPKDGP